MSKLIRNSLIASILLSQFVSCTSYTGSCGGKSITFELDKEPFDLVAASIKECYSEQDSSHIIWDDDDIITKEYYTSKNRGKDNWDLVSIITPHDTISLVFDFNVCSSYYRKNTIRVKLHFADLVLHSPSVKGPVKLYSVSRPKDVNRKIWNKSQKFVSEFYKNRLDSLKRGVLERLKNQQWRKKQSAVIDSLAKIKNKNKTKQANIGIAHIGNIVWDEFNTTDATLICNSTATDTIWTLEMQGYVLGKDTLLLKIGDGKILEFAPCDEKIAHVNDNVGYSSITGEIMEYYHYEFVIYYKLTSAINEIVKHGILKMRLGSGYFHKDKMFKKNELGDAITNAYKDILLKMSPEYVPPKKPSIRDGF